ncbi:hypothetical protein [Streptomyces sp. enrichment culture]|uniref:hypothetical protein n=1 Tax=Streptomyces sp. enrichment culture TaxID=1795815 RepID=UPI003F555F48
MAEVAANEPDERVAGRRWTVRLDPAGRGSTVVRVSCSRPACADQRLPSPAVGRAAAVAHLKAHLRAAAGPRADAHCACRSESCHLHLRPAERPDRAPAWRCGGAVVLAVVADREGRWWQVMECCSRCAAATPGAQVVDTAPGATPRTPPGTAARTPRGAAAGPVGPRPAGDPAVPAEPSARGPVGVPQFSHLPEPGARPGAVPQPRSAAPRRRPPVGRIAQRYVPHDLQPAVLRDELVELGSRFRAYQQRSEPDLALLAELHERKARAFAAWADVSGDVNLRLEARRAEQAAATARAQHLQRTGQSPDDGTPAVARVLTSPAQWDHARSVLAHVAEHCPLPGADARLLVLVLTLRAAHSGQGNLVGQDLNSLGVAGPEELVEQLTGCGWLRLPGTVDDLLASRPESPTPITIPSLLPGPDGSGPFTFGRKLRPKLSGWAQRVISDKKLRKAKATSAVRLLALELATRTDASGLLGTGGQGIPLASLAARVETDADALQAMTDQLTRAGWLTDAALSATHLTGRLSERVLPFTCPLA